MAKPKPSSERLRAIAVHLETAALLELRAAEASDARQADRLRQGALRRRQAANQLRVELAGGRPAGSRPEP